MAREETYLDHQLARDQKVLDHLNSGEEFWAASRRVYLSRLISDAKKVLHKNPDEALLGSAIVAMALHDSKS